MKQTDKELIELFKQKFEYKEGILYWKEGQNIGKPLGSLSDGYLYTSVTISPRKYLRMYVHRIIFAMHKGYLPKLVDHKDRVKLNNLIENLRDITPKSNSINRSIDKRSKSGVLGVTWHKKSRKWAPLISINGKLVNLGYSHCLGKAIKARKAAEKIHYNI